METVQGVVPQADWVGRAQRLQAMLNAAGPRCDADNELPSEVVEALHETGLFRLLIPRDLDGAEVDLGTFSAVIEAIAEGDGSTAWCLGQNAVSNMTSAYLAHEDAQKVFADHRTVFAWGAGVQGQAIAVDGGFRVSGRWGFGSGSRHATWLGGQAPMKSPDGVQWLEPDGSPTYRTFIFPKTSCQVTNGWDVIGLRGTGSDTYEVNDLFVPDQHLFKRTVPAPHPAALYRTPLATIYPISFASVALGLARSILKSFTDMARKKAPQGLPPMRESAAIQSILGHAAIRLDSARTNLRAMIREIDGAVMDDEQAVRLRGITTFTTHESLAVADVLFQEAGATAILVNQSFERRFRDIHAVAQQVQARRQNFETVGKSLMGLETGPLFL
jgi:alkylation response protein AidB-like acyl-CoA dehydrogenase